ncbi:MAG: histidine ammonia-lyase [Planctomycetota bacterium]|nr:histidine ammonia-lyase [Planctomycetota bacterium]
MAKPSSTLEISGRTLTVDQVDGILGGQTRRIALSPAAIRRIRQSRTALERLEAKGKPIYGINTGFGRLSNVQIPREKVDALQRNLILSHSAGVGPPLSMPETRLAMALRIHTLAKGHSAVRLELVESLIALFNKGVTPVVPEQGSVGASGDLAPLAHIALTLIGEGEAHYDGEVLTGGAALKKAGLTPLSPRSKEGLALVNGTQVSTAIAWRNVIAADRIARTADIAGALTLEALRGNPLPFDRGLSRLRPHPGHEKVAANVRSIIQGSEIRGADRRGAHLQDPYSIRCIPQVHGAARDTIDFVRGLVRQETETVTDNPLILSVGLRVISGGNFHGQAIGMGMDILAIALSTLGGISERRTERLLNPDTSGLPPFLAKEGGLHSGLMMAQVTAAALTAENKVLSHPISLDSVPTSGNQEDYVPMAPAAGRKAREIAQNVERILAIEILCACQGIDFLRPKKPGRGAAALHRAVRRKVPRLEGDRVLYGDIEAVRKLVADGEVLRAVQQVTGRIR